MQGLRVTLLTGDRAGGPGIADYAGRGDLGAWLRSVTVRTALKSLRQARRDRPVDADLDALAAPGASPELALLRASCAADFRAALAEALAALSARDRTLLRQHFVDNLTIDELAPVYGVHRATAARWLARLRAEVLGQTRDALARRLGPAAPELTSVLRLIDSQLDLSLSRLLRT